MSKRIIYIDYCKAFAILLVVLGHILQFVYCKNTYFENHTYRYIYSFHMPLFMALSGLCSSIEKKDFKILFSKRFVQLIIPFFTWACITQLCGGVNVISTLLNPSNGLWFLYDLFFIDVIFFTLYRFSVKFNLNCVIINFIGCVFLFSISLILPDIFDIKSIAWYYPFFCLGYILKKRSMILDKKHIMFLMFLCWLFMGWFWIQRVDSNSAIGLPFMHLKIVLYIWKYLTAVFGVMSILSFFKSYSEYFDSRILTFWGTNTLGIYAIHFHLLNILQYTPSFIEKYWFIYIPISIMSIMLISCCLIWLFKKNRTSSFLLLGQIIKK